MSFPKLERFTWNSALVRVTKGYGVTGDSEDWGLWIDYDCMVSMAMEDSLLVVAC